MDLAVFVNSKFFENFIFLFLVLIPWYVMASIGPATGDRLIAILSRKRKKKGFWEGWLKWELWLGNSMLGSINWLQKRDTKINLHTNL